MHVVAQINTTVLFHSQGTGTKSELGVYFSNPTATEKKAKDAEGEDSDNSEEKDQDSA